MGEWQKLFVKKMVEEVGLTHTKAMEIMGMVCDIRQKVYMEGFDRGWVGAINQDRLHCPNCGYKLRIDIKAESV